MLKHHLVAILIVGALLPGKAFAWDEEGHKIVALIADHYLDPAVKQKIDAMLAADTDTLTKHDIASEAVWADTYWPATDGSHNARWQDASTKSPLEKYDAAFNNAPGCDTMPALYGDGRAAERVVAALTLIAQ